MSRCAAWIKGIGCGYWRIVGSVEALSAGEPGGTIIERDKSW